MVAWRELAGTGPAAGAAVAGRADIRQLAHVGRDPRAFDGRAWLFVTGYLLIQIGRSLFLTIALRGQALGALRRPLSRPALVSASPTAARFE
jgi:hypothetical protein